MARKHELDEVLRSLGHKHDCRIKNKTIMVLNGKGRKRLKHDLGNSSWGKIDYLTHYCGYRLYLVSDFK